MPDDGTEVRLIVYGHPPPLLLRPDGITPPAAHHPAPPLSLGELAPAEYQVEAFPFLPGDRQSGGGRRHGDGAGTTRGRRTTFSEQISKSVR
ncbi:SpoIIE family protein phosphatase [Kitasatospora sp. NPDC001660]